MLMAHPVPICDRVIFIRTANVYYSYGNGITGCMYEPLGDDKNYSIKEIGNYAHFI